LLDVQELSVSFAMPRKSLFGERPVLHAVRDVSFSLSPGRTLGLVGESGSGKTTTAMATIRLTAAQSGSVMFDGVDLLKLDPEAMRRQRRHLQVIFQDPYSSLNPRERVGAVVREPLDLMMRGTSRAEREDRVRELFGLVGLRPDQMALFPHQFSGGQRQRVSIARALATNPRLVVCDEPVSALDVAIQAQILNLLRRLQGEYGLSYLFISHDLAVVKALSHQLLVIRQGKVVEGGPAQEIFSAPQHPYTQQLLEAAFMAPAAALED
jgi:peptide/nickel transport system ATP-binding protein